MSPFLLRRLTDELLGSRLASGEAAAFDELYRRYLHRLSAYGAHLLGDASAGDDVAQSTLLKAYGALRDGRVPEHVRPWLYRIAHNTAIDLAVRRRELPVEALPERQASEGESPGALVAALAALPDRQRRVYVLRELHGLRIDETALELGLAAGQVEQALFAARNRLAEQLTFGERLNCVAVRRLATGPLDGDERRALRTHLRSCADCREAVQLRGRAFGMTAGTVLDWLRGLAATAVGGSAPVAAKLGAVVAATSLAAVPAAVDVAQPHAKGEPRFRGVPAGVARRTQPVPVTRVVVAAHRTPVASVPVVATTAPRVAHRDDHGATRRRSHVAEAPEPVATETEHQDGASDGPGPGTTGAVDSAPLPPPVTTTTTTSTSEPGPSSDGSNEGPSGGGGEDGSSSDGHGGDSIDDLH